MKRLCLIVIPVALLIFALVSGCNDKTDPAFTRIIVSPACGVVPLQVDAYAIVSGGNETGNATGGNNNLEISWNFGDGHTSRTSIAYNDYLIPGDYTVVATAKDPDGKTASTSMPVKVLADSLVIEASSDFPGGEVTTADTVTFDLRAESCDINPDEPGDYVKMAYRWDMGTGYMDTGDPDDPEDDVWVEYVYPTRNPRFRFFEPGQYDVSVTVTYPAWAVTRRDTLHFNVTAAP